MNVPFSIPDFSLCKKASNSDIWDCLRVYWEFEQIPQILARKKKILFYRRLVDLSLMPKNSGMVH